jgi:hypothetical protein
MTAFWHSIVAVKVATVEARLVYCWSTLLESRLIELSTPANLDSKAFLMRGFP